ncbi:MAG: Asp-tRNA(Asn)/Glu-tRNA(Gln) amidotransferase subunit GatC, partial [Abditibacteriota bacterium]|nr:Asp-tRNA(Asn)/Glu-tRNA(Gln) amidotransferase subunit GatC [Abditibacteriota bacterium]
MLTKEDIEAIAHLSRLETGEDADKLTEQINKLLENFKSLQALDTEGVPPTSHAVPMYNVFREDEPRPSLSPDEVISNGPDTQDRCFVVPR